MEKISKLLELFIGDEVYTGDVKHMDRQEINPTDLNKRGLMLYRFRPDEKFTLGIHQDTFVEVNRWCPINYYELCNTMYQLINKKFPKYEIKSVSVSGGMEFYYSLDIKKDDECLVD